MGDLDLHVTEGWLRRGFRPINPKTLSASGTETLTAAADTTSRTISLPAGTKAVLQWSDLSLLGTYALPAGQSTYVSGLTHRWVGGEAYPRLYTVSHNQNVIYESQPIGEPSLGSPAAMTSVGTLGELRVPPSAPGYYYDTYGLHWDEESQRLYFCQQRYYALEDWPTWGYATVTPTRPSVATTQGVWAVAPISGYGSLWHLGVTGIPAWFANQYTGGRQIALGFGSGSMSQQSGNKHYGLALFAAHGIDLTRDRVRPYQQGYWYEGGLVPLSGHPYHASRPMRRGNFGGDWYEYAEAGIGTTGYDMTGWCNLSSGVWIDTPTKHGLLITMAAVDALWPPTSRTTVNAATPAGSLTLSLTANPAGLQAGDLLFVQSQHHRTSPPNNGVFGPDVWNPPPGETYVPGNPYGEVVRVTGPPTGQTVPICRSNRDGLDEPGLGLRGAVSAGAWVLMGGAYFDAVVPSSRRRIQLYGFDPMRFAEVTEAGGATRAWDDVPWTWCQDHPFPDTDAIGKGGNYGPGVGHAADMTYDAVQGRLYMLRHFGLWMSSSYQSCLYVFQVAS